MLRSLAPQPCISEASSFPSFGPCSAWKCVQAWCVAAGCGVPMLTTLCTVISQQREPYRRAQCVSSRRGTWRCKTMNNAPQITNVFTSLIGYTVQTMLWCTVPRSFLFTVVTSYFVCTLYIMSVCWHPIPPPPRQSLRHPATPTAARAVLYTRESLALPLYPMCIHVVPADARECV